MVSVLRASSPADVQCTFDPRTCPPRHEIEIDTIRFMLGIS